MWKRCWTWSEGNPAPHFHDVSQRLESLVTGSLDQQRHSEVSSLEPLRHLLITERTWNNTNQYRWGGRASQAKLNILETKSMVLVKVTQYLGSGAPVCLIHLSGQTVHSKLDCQRTYLDLCGGHSIPPDSLYWKVHDCFYHALEGNDSSETKAKQPRWCGAWVQPTHILPSSKAHCSRLSNRLTTGAVSSLDLNSIH